VNHFKRQNKEENLRCRFLFAEISVPDFHEVLLELIRCKTRFTININVAGPENKNYS
jgi:hypothetical protein